MAVLMDAIAQKFGPAPGQVGARAYIHSHTRTHVQKRTGVAVCRRWRTSARRTSGWLR